jgi:hypothetical protein
MLGAKGTFFIVFTLYVWYLLFCSRAFGGPYVDARGVAEHPTLFFIFWHATSFAKKLRCCIKHHPILLYTLFLL